MNKNEKEIQKLIDKYIAQKRMISTWEVLKIKDFHLDTNLIVIHQQDLQELLSEVLKISLLKPE